MENGSRSAAASPKESRLNTNAPKLPRNVLLKNRSGQKGSPAASKEDKPAVDSTSKSLLKPHNTHGSTPESTRNMTAGLSQEVQIDDRAAGAIGAPEKDSFSNFGDTTWSNVQGEVRGDSQNASEKSSVPEEILQKEEGKATSMFMLRSFLR